MSGRKIDVAIISNFDVLHDLLLALIMQQRLHSKTS